MKKLICILSITVMLLCVLVSCGDNEPEITVNTDGYVVVNGITTNIIADKDDVITVDNDGYVIVNGVKTEHKIHTTDEISVNSGGYVVVNGVTTNIIADKADVIIVDNDGYVIVNGVKTEHKIHTTDEITVNADGYVVVNGVSTNIVADKDDVITVDNDGYVIVNGVKTEYEIKNKNHIFTDWRIIVDPTNTTTGISQRYCTICTYTESKTVCGTLHSADDWVIDKQPTCTEDGIRSCYCSVCEELLSSEAITKVGHSFESNVCTVCGAEDGLEYVLSDDQSYYILKGIGTCKDKDVTIATSYKNLPVKEIADHAFANNTEITSIFIPDTIVSIGRRAFYGCTGLTEIQIPKSVTTIGTQIFLNATNLSTVYYASRYQNSDENPFLSEPHIKTIVFNGNGVNSIIQNCKNIENVIVSENGAHIFSNSLDGCSNIQSITLPKNFYSSATSFGSCKIKNVYYGGTIEDWLNVFNNYGDTSWYYCNPLCNGANLYCEGELVTELTIPNTFSRIKRILIQGCTSITTLTIPNSVVTIDEGAFAGCKNITDVFFEGTIAEWRAIRNSSQLDGKTIHCSDGTISS